MGQSMIFKRLFFGYRRVESLLIVWRRDKSRHGYFSMTRARRRIRVAMRVILIRRNKSQNGQEARPWVPRYGLEMTIGVKNGQRKKTSQYYII